MRAPKTFEEYKDEGVVRTVSKDPHRAQSLLQEAQRKYASSQNAIRKLGVEDNNANDHIEHFYDILIFVIRAAMYDKGFASSGLGAHEAEIAYARKLSCTEQEVRFLDELRYFRNGILYYGKQLDAQYAKKVIIFTQKTYPKLKTQAPTSKTF